MPNHIHSLIGFVPGDKSINTIIANAKRFMAYDIVDRLRVMGCNEMLAMLAEGVSLSDRKKGALHEVFQPSFDAKLCHSYRFITQKLTYIHNNPVSKKWSLVKYAGDYVHSSAGYYDTGRPGVYDVMNVGDRIAEHWASKYALLDY